ncbi:Detected protein of unknown function [Hibiscus syriacus]|uniref:Uncharacterized protein n=1 Tax=Hibiscus syriacus TaxID=106335 RepID=A0A6A2WKY5_HIBSY|nr:Detected protein of unknown function [Hibiscus syriacus]
MSRTSTRTTPEISLGSLNRINLEGSNVGATTFIRRGSSSSGEPPEGCCCINIHTNSNVQGTNSCVLLGSVIRIKNSGVHLYSGDLKLGEECCCSGSRSISRVRTAEFGSILMLVSVPLFLFVCLSSLLLW